MSWNPVHSESKVNDQTKHSILYTSHSLLKFWYMAIQHKTECFVFPSSSLVEYQGWPIAGSDKITTLFLLTFKRLEQRLEVPGSESREVMSLDYFNENRGTVHEMLQWSVCS